MELNNDRTNILVSGLSYLVRIRLESRLQHLGEEMTIDIKAIRAAAKEDQKRDNTILLRPTTVIAMCDEIDRLKDLLGKANALCRIRADEIERLQKDAARYRWLRSHPMSFGHGSLQVFMDDRCGSGNYHKMVWDKELDAAIDKQLEERKT